MNRQEELDETTRNGNYICCDCGKKIVEFDDVLYKERGKLIHGWVTYKNGLTLEEIEENTTILLREHPDGIYKPSIYCCRKCFKYIPKQNEITSLVI